MAILVTGGAGFIGSHTCVELLNAGLEPIVADNLSNSSEESLRRVERITGKRVKFYRADVCDASAIDKIFARHKIDAVIHFAGYKAVGESCRKPGMYYRNNLDSTLTLTEVMARHGVYNLVFSSSATVYGDPASVPIREDFPLHVTNPYGRTKLMTEEILRDLHTAEPKWNIALLRYFNPIGAHESGLIGEDPNGIPNNLVPYVTQVAIGKLPFVRVFGDGYATEDGTGVRDYIHVVDLAKGHAAAIEKLKTHIGVQAYNLGTGHGYSVFQVIHAMEHAAGREIPYKVVEPRDGDIAACYADPEFAAKELGWRAEKGIDQMCADAWHWQTENPNGYGGKR